MGVNGGSYQAGIVFLDWMRSQQTLFKFQKHNERLLAEWREPVFLPFGVVKRRPGLYQGRQAG